ncbi:putative RNA-directed DNA polymerase [Helianthus anomalus]
MKSDESPSPYLEQAQEYADALANIGEPVKDKDLVMLVIAGLRDEYHSLKGNIVARQFPPAFSELHALLADHDFLVRKAEPVPPTQVFSAVTNPTPPAPGLLGPSNDGLYTFCLPRIQDVPKVAFSTARVSSKTWHQRLGHPHHQLLNTMFSKYCLPISDKPCSFVCDTCLVGKSSKLYLPLSNYHSSHILDLVICDVWGPASVSSYDGHSYFLLCVDHYSKFMWFFPLKLKSYVFATFRQFITMVERQFKTKLISVQTDWGDEFSKLSPFFLERGIIH